MTRKGVPCGNRAAPWGTGTKSESLPKVYALQFTPRQKQHRTAEMNKRGPLSQRALRMQAIWSRSRDRENNFFWKWSTVAWAAETYGLRYVRDAIHWFFRKFNVDRVNSLRAFKAAAHLIMMCTATAPLFKQHLHPFMAATAAGIPLSYEDIIMDPL